MFYLVNEKNNLSNESILINAHNLEAMETVTESRDDLELTFHFANETFSFSFNENNFPHADQIIQEISELTPKAYTTPFIVLTDIENINTFKELNFNPKILKKAISILVKINDIYLVCEKDNEYYLHTSQLKLTIKESPEEVFKLIQFHIQQENSVLNKKTQLKEQL